jgi:PPM family protein phosphatase
MWIVRETMMSEDKKLLTHTFGWLLDKGLRRSNNEDSLGATKINRVSNEGKESIGVYVIADGVGGQQDGEKASQLAVETVMEAMLNKLGNERGDEACRGWLRAAALMANRQIRLSHSAISQSATTLLIAMVLEQTVHIANVGDSRAYILSGDELRQITKDHTLTQMLVDSGMITEEQAEVHPARHALSQAVGSHDNIDVDVFTEKLKVDDYLLLCSDGLYGAISSDDIKQIIIDTDTPQVASEKLIKAANDAGGPDNIAVVVIQIKARE